MGEKIVSTSPGAFSLYEKSRFGEKKGKRIEYSSVEALYLVLREKMEVISLAKRVGEDALLRKLKRKDKRFETKFAAFADLRSRGYIVKAALKFGAEFRVYQKGDKPGKNHSKWIFYSVKESEQMSWHDFAAKSRVAHSTKKNLLLGVVDGGGDVTYYEVGWFKV